jgi:hypothetical protein
MSASELRPEDWPLLRWIAEAGREGRSCHACHPATGRQESDGRVRLEAAGLVWTARRRADGEHGDARHVVAGLGLIALAKTEGRA